MIVTISGVYLCFSQVSEKMVKTVMPARDLRQMSNEMRVAPVAEGTAIDIDAAVDLARTAVPGAAWRIVRMHQHPSQPIRVNMVRPGFEQGQPMITAHVDQWTVKVIEVFDPATYSSAELMFAWQRGLHEGSGLRWTWKILVFLSGFLPVLFAITGTIMWFLKRRTRRAALAMQRTQAE